MACILPENTRIPEKYISRCTEFILIYGIFRSIPNINKFGKNDVETGEPG